MRSPNIARERLYSQQLEGTRLAEPAQVVAWLGAVQAQDYAGAKWSLGLRLPAATEADVEQAIESNAIVRTWAMRGTLHFVAAADARWLLGLLAPKIIAGCARRYRELELDEATLKRSSRVLARSVAGGRRLMRS
ncbi:MAG: crosslink repair DNA glycosylase YcaQ family protein, partial [Anaerolineales bacterium]